MAFTLEQGAWVHPSIEQDSIVHVGFHSCVGHGEAEGDTTHLGNGVRTGAFCVIEHGVHIGDNVQIDHYCRISRGTKIGSDTRILYRAQIFENVQIGKNCIIAGELVDRTAVGDAVTFQGNTAHTHRDPTADWDETEEPSPVIQTGSVVGIGALLIGGISVGPCSYIAAGEIVRSDVPPNTVLQGGELQPLSRFRGLIKVRC